MFMLDIKWALFALSLLSFWQCDKLIDITRKLSINLGGGACVWTAPSYLPPNGTFFNTLVVGFPGGSKRIVYSQLEALTGQAFNDEWPTFLNRPSRAFIKANYPHHEGTWGFNKGTNQVIMIMRNPRHAIIEYHDVLSDIHYATDPETAWYYTKNLYMGRPGLDKWREWRELRMHAEAHWYGWFIDYWMEGGIARDIPSHRPVTELLFNKSLIIPGPYYESGQAYKDMIGNASVTPTFDSHCINDMPNGNCEAVLIISAEKLLDPILGYAEAEKLALAVEGKKGIDVIAKEARPCIWDELMINKKGLRTMVDRSGPSQSKYKFKLEHLYEMIEELTRLKAKYSESKWSNKTTAKDLVSILDDYIVDVNSEVANGNYE